MGTLGDLNVGADSGGTESRKLNGAMDEVAIYGYVLSPDQIHHHYNLGKGIYPGSVINIY